MEERVERMEEAERQAEGVGIQPRGAEERGLSPSGGMRKRATRVGSPVPATRDDVAGLATSLYHVQRELDLERRARELERERSAVERERAAFRQEQMEDRRRRETVQRSFLDWLGRNTYFVGVEITAYLRRYELGMRVLQLTDEELCHYFLMTVEPKVEAKARAALSSVETWKEGKAKLRTAFAAADKGRATAMSFAKWISNPAKEQETPEDILAEFERLYEELEEEEQIAYGNKIKHYVQALPDKIRLAFSEPLYDESQSVLVATWEQVRRRARGFTARLRDARGLEWPERSASAEALNTGGYGAPAARQVSGATGDPRLEELTRKMSEMAATLNRLAGQQDRGPPSARPDRCIFCDMIGHRRDGCESFRRALAQGVVRMTNGRVCRQNGSEVPPRFGRGGMRQVLIDEGCHPGGGAPPPPPPPASVSAPAAQGARGFSTTVTAPWESAEAGWGDDTASDYLPTSAADLPESTERFVTCNAATGVVCEEKRAQPQAERLDGKRVRMERPMDLRPSTAGPQQQTDSTSRPPAAPTRPRPRAGGPPSETVRLESAVGRGFDLEKFVERAILEQTVPVTIRELLAACQQGAAGVPGVLGDVMRRKRVVAANYCEAEELSSEELPDSDTIGGPEVGSYFQRTGVEEPGQDVPDRRRYPAKAKLWARPVSETSVYVPGLGRSVKALIDSGSEVNLVEQWVAEEAGWRTIADPGWTLHTATGKEPILAAAPDATIEIASVETNHNFFVQRSLGYPMILGQPWRARLNYRSIWKWDGTEIGEVTSPDNRVARFAVVRTLDPRHRDRLGSAEDLEEGDLEGERQDF